MKIAFRLTTIAAAAALIWAVHTPSWSQAADPDGYGDGYQSGAYGRIRSADGGATIVRADGESGDSGRAGVNAPIFPGDTLRTGADQRVEVQLAGGTVVRIDRGGEVVFQSLPNPSAKLQDNTVLVLNGGALRVTSRLGDKDEFRIDTRDASVYLVGEGDFRIEADERGGTRVASLRGVAELVGNETSVLVRGGQRSVVVAGSAPDAPRAYSAFASDGFDRWCEARDEAYRSHDRNTATDDVDRSQVPEEVRPYYSELSQNGEFAEDPEYGTVWYPSGVGAGWRPYYDGYWSYGPGGYFWVSYEPWGWAPYHYGNWQWTYRGWCWVPGRVFAGAWVSWSWGSLYIGWAPLDYWGRPAWLGGPYYGGYYDPGCWTFVNYGHFHDDHLRRYAVPIATVRPELGQNTVVSRPPRVDPKRIAQSPEWRDRALRQVSDDHAARMRPIQPDRRPTQRMSDVQDHLLRRAPQGQGRIAPSKDVSDRPSIDRRATSPRPRRILEDQRQAVTPERRPETRDDVRDFYQRMSRPRETRAQDDVAPSRDHRAARIQELRETPRPQRVDPPRAQAPSQPAPRAQAPRQQAPQQQAPRAQPQQQQAPRAQSPRQQAPRQQAPRQQAPKQKAPAQDKPKHGGRH